MAETNANEISDELKNEQESETSPENQTAPAAEEKTDTSGNGTSGEMPEQTETPPEQDAWETRSARRYQISRRD